MGVNSRFNPKEATSKYSSIFTRHHTNFLIYHTNTEGMTLGKKKSLLHYMQQDGRYYYREPEADFVLPKKIYFFPYC